MRKTLRYTIPGTRADAVGSRDCGKTFVLTEAPADQAMRWCLRALMAAAGGGMNLPDGWQDAGPDALAAIGIKALFSMPWGAAEPLLAEVMACVQYQPETAGALPMRILEGDACQIEDPGTFFRLQVKVLELHSGFSLPGAPSTSG